MNFNVKFLYSFCFENLSDRREKKKMERKIEMKINFTRTTIYRENKTELWLFPNNSFCGWKKIQNMANNKYMRERRKKNNNNNNIYLLRICKIYVQCWNSLSLVRLTASASYSGSWDGIFYWSIISEFPFCDKTTTIHISQLKFNSQMSNS